MNNNKNIPRISKKNSRIFKGSQTNNKTRGAVEESSTKEPYKKSISMPSLRQP